jgi:adenosylcobinamide-GDP ribazoletransferase
MNRPLNAFVTAVQFLTRLPLPGGLNRADADGTLLQSALVFFPLVGGLIGALTGGIIWIAAHFWPLLIAILFGLIIEALATGAFHEDAVADCCDAFGGGWARADVLRILKDSRIGSFGALGLFLAVALRIGCLAALDLSEIVAVAIASAGLGRWATLVFMAIAPPIPGRDGLAAEVAQRIGQRAFVLGTLLALPAAAWFAWIDPLRCACGWGATGAAALIWAWYVRRRLGGGTGDCVGFICYAGQVLVLLVATMHFSQHRFL